MEYQVVNTERLVALLGTQCSPVGKCRYSGIEPGYVVGPNVNGELSHLATCYSMNDAHKLVASWSALK